MALLLLDRFMDKEFKMLAVEATNPYDSYQINDSITAFVFDHPNFNKYEVVLARLKRMGTPGTYKISLKKSNFIL